MIDKKEIELLIRAKLQGKGDIASIAKSINDLEKAIDSQTAAAKKGEGSIDELRASLLALQGVQDKLSGQASLVNTFQKTTDAVERTAARVKSAGDAYTAYKTKLDAIGDVTDKQQDKLIKLSASYDRAQAALLKQQTTLESLKATLTEAGIETTNLAEAETRLRDGAAQIGTSIAKTRDAISTYSEDLRRARQATKDLQDTQAAAAKIAAEFAASEKRSADATKELAAETARAAAAQEAANQRNQSLDSSAAIRRTSEAARDGAAYIKFWHDELNRNDSLRKLADDTETGARAMTTLSRASTDLTPRVISLREAVNSITSPVDTAKASLAGVEASVTGVAAAVGKIRGPVRDASEQFKALSDASKAISNQAGFVDAFRQQTTALRTARSEFTAAREQVNQYAAAVRAGGDAGQSFVKPLADAQSRLRATAQALRDQVVATRESRDALRQAGIDTNNLAAAEQRLTTVARNTAAATKDLGAAVDRYGESSRRAAAGGGIFGGDDGRTTLSLMQRIRGEVLALAAAYTGVQGAVNIATQSISAFNSRAQARSTLSVGLGTTNKQAIDDEYAYVRGQADRIGLVFDSTVKQFGKFSTAAAQAGRGRQEIRAIFESFAESGQVLGLSGENMEGIFKALEQVFSKGKITAEELRQQLGDRLPAAFEIAQKALAKQFPDLNKAMEQGQVGAENLVLIANEYRRLVAEQLPEAQKSLVAEQARMTNAVNDFKLAVADGGFAKAYTDALREITIFLKSDDGKKFAQSLSESFSTVAKIAAVVAQNFDLIRTALAGLLALKVAGAIAGMVTGFVELNAALQTATGSVGALQKAFILLQVFIAAWTIGTILYEKFAVVRQIGAFIVGTFAATWKIVEAGAEIAADEIPRFFSNAFAVLGNVATLGARKFLEVFKTIAEAVGADELSANIEKAIGSLTFGFKEQTSTVGAIKDRLKKDLDEIRQFVSDAGKEEAKSPTAAATASPTTAPPFDPKKKGPTDAEIAKRLKAIEAITRALETLDAKIDRAQTDNLSKQLAAIDTQYQALSRKIKALGGPEAKTFQTTLDEDTNQLKLQTIKQFNDKLAKEQESLQTKIENVEVAAGKKQKQDLDTRLAAIAKSYEDTYRDIAAQRAKLEANGLDTSGSDELRRRLDLGVQELQSLERKKVAEDQIKLAEQQLSAALQERSDKLKVISDRLADQKISVEDARIQSNAVIAEMQPQIEQLTAAGRTLAESVQGAFDPVKIQAFLASLDRADASAGRLTQRFTQFQQMVGSGGMQLINQTLQNAGNHLERMASGAESVSQGFKGMLRDSLLFFADFLRKIAIAIIQQMIFNALKSSGNPYLAAIGSAGSASNTGAAAIQHVGGFHLGSSSRTRQVPMGWFSNAPRYHQGGFAGLGPNEYAAVLEKNEEVLAKDSPRNALNGGAALGGTPEADQASGLKFVLLDDRSKVADAMQSVEGERVILHTLTRNLSTVKQLISGR